MSKTADASLDIRPSDMVEVTLVLKADTVTYKKDGKSLLSGWTKEGMFCIVSLEGCRKVENAIPKD